MTQNTQKTKDLTMTRTFDAPTEKVWQAWTDPEYMQRWWAPHTFSTPTCQIDLKVGGKYLRCIRSAQGQDFWRTGVYREITPFSKLVYTEAWADKNGNVVPASAYGMSSDWPIEQIVTVIFEEQQGQTKLTLLYTNMPDDKMAEAGWNESLKQSFDKLAQNLIDQGLHK